MINKKPQCSTCKHNINTISCSSCASKGIKMIEKIANELNEDLPENLSNEIDSFKYSCKIIMRYPEEFKKLDPFNCKYYIPSFYRF